MKNCVMCRKELTEDFDVCQTCLDFLKWKYPKKYIEKINEFRKLSEQDNSSDSTKCYRRKK